MFKDTEWISRAQREAVGQMKTKKDQQRADELARAKQAENEERLVKEKVAEAKEILNSFMVLVNPLLTQLRKAGYKVSLTQGDSIRNTDGYCATDVEYFTDTEISETAERLNKTISRSYERSIAKKGRYSSPYVEVNPIDVSDPDSSRSRFVWESPLVKVSVKKALQSDEVTFRLVAADQGISTQSISDITELKIGPQGTGTSESIHTNQISFEDLGHCIALTFEMGNSHIISPGEEGVRQFQQLLGIVIFEIEKKYHEQQEELSKIPWFDRTWF